MSYSLPEGIRQAILNHATLPGLLSGVSSTFAPNSFSLAKPWIVFTKVSGEEELSHDGDDGLTHPRYQFTIGGIDKRLVDVVRDLLVKFNGTEYVYTEAAIDNVLTFVHAGDHEEHDPTTKSYRAFVDLIVWANT